MILKRFGVSRLSQSERVQRTVAYRVQQGGILDQGIPMGRDHGLESGWPVALSEFLAEAAFENGQHGGDRGGGAG